MTRLPGYDSSTRRSELAVFCGLGFAALALIGFTLASAARFAANREAIIASLSSEPALMTAEAKPSKTNVALAPPRPAGLRVVPAAFSGAAPCCSVQSM